MWLDRVQSPDASDRRHASNLPPLRYQTEQIGMHAHKTYANYDPGGSTDSKDDAWSTSWRGSDSPYLEPCTRALLVFPIPARSPIVTGPNCTAGSHALRPAGSKCISLYPGDYFIPMNPMCP
jgi:hypothetical protein